MDNWKYNITNVILHYPNENVLMRATEIRERKFVQCKKFNICVCFLIIGLDLFSEIRGVGEVRD